MESPLFTLLSFIVHLILKIKERDTHWKSKIEVKSHAPFHWANENTGLIEYFHILFVSNNAFLAFMHVELLWFIERQRKKAILHWILSKCFEANVAEYYYYLFFYQKFIAEMLNTSIIAPNEPTINRKNVVHFIPITKV